MKGKEPKSFSKDYIDDTIEIKKAIIKFITQFFSIES